MSPDLLVFEYIYLLGFMPHRLVDIDRRFRGSNPETSVYVYHCTWHSVLKDSHLHRY
jgi:hypothetical protein